MPAHKIKTSVCVNFRRFAPQNWLSWQRPSTEVHQTLSYTCCNIFIDGVNATIRVAIRPPAVEWQGKHLKLECSQITYQFPTWRSSVLCSFDRGNSLYEQQTWMLTIGLLNRNTGGWHTSEKVSWEKDRALKIYKNGYLGLLRGHLRSFAMSPLSNYTMISNCHLHQW